MSQMSARTPQRESWQGPNVMMYGARSRVGGTFGRSRTALHYAHSMLQCSSQFPQSPESADGREGRPLRVSAFENPINVQWCPDV